MFPEDDQIVLQVRLWRQHIPGCDRGLDRDDLGMAAGSALARNYVRRFIHGSSGTPFQSNSSLHQATCLLATQPKQRDARSEP